MTESLIALLHALSTISPLGVIALLALVIWQMWKGGLHPTNAELATNHLHELPQIAADLREMKELLMRMNDLLVHIKARVNGR